MLIKFLPNFDEISFVILIESFKLSELNDIFINPSWLETFRLLDWTEILLLIKFSIETGLDDCPRSELLKSSAFEITYS